MSEEVGRPLVHLKDPQQQKGVMDEKQKQTFHLLFGGEDDSGAAS